MAPGRPSYIWLAKIVLADLFSRHGENMPLGAAVRRIQGCPKAWLPWRRDPAREEEFTAAQGVTLLAGTRPAEFPFTPAPLLITPRSPHALFPAEPLYGRAQWGRS